MRAKDVIAEELKDHGADFLGDSRDDIAEAILAKLESAGYVVVPKEPTDQQQQYWCRLCARDHRTPQEADACCRS